MRHDRAQVTAHAIRPQAPITEQGTEYSILATSRATKGYGAIAVRQSARVKAERFVGQVESVFVQHGMANPQLLARKYEMLVDLDRP